MAAALMPALAQAALLVDDFDRKAQSNLLGGNYVVFTDGHSTMQPAQGLAFVEGCDSPAAARFDYELKTGGTAVYAGVSIALEAGGQPRDISRYAGVRFWVRGRGTIYAAVGTTFTMTNGAYNHYRAAPFDLTEQWQQVEIPFKQFRQLWEPKADMDATKARLLQLVADSGSTDKGWFAVDRLELWEASEATAQPEPNPIVHGPKVNQVGYLPDGPKRFSIVEQDAAGGADFEVRQADGTAVFQGKLVPKPVDDIESCGERVYQGDFSALNQAGTYTVVVGQYQSAPFRIGADLYRKLYRDAARTFYTIRSGIALDDAETGIAHKLSHATDARVELPGSAGGTGKLAQRDLTGGWYNAGDFGKWTHMVAISSSYMMWLHELRGPAVSAIDLNIPESRNSLPDLLDQAQWGLQWLLRMQNPDGSVMHKVDSGHNFCFGKRPEDDPYERRATFASSIDAGVFVGVMLQASRVYAEADPPFARRCRAAADKTWQWLRANPDVRHSDPFYVDPDATQERLWALGEMARATRDANLVAEFRAGAQRHRLGPPGWQAPEMFGYLAVAEGLELDASARDMAAKAIVAVADDLLTRSNASGYGVAMTAVEYSWESLETVLHRAAALVFAYELTRDGKYRQAAVRQLDYALGLNSLGLSLVTGHGTRCVQRPYHWTYVALGKSLPGWAAGGPNRYPTGADPLLLAVQAEGTPPAKCFVDGRSWASNEGETTENAALLFLAGYMLRPDGNQAMRDLP